MAKYRLKSDIVDMIAALPIAAADKAGTVIPEYAEESEEKAKETIARLLETMRPERIENWSARGGTMPMGMFLQPHLATYYAAGYGALQTMLTSKTFETYRFTPEIITRLALRKWEDDPKGKDFWDDLKDQGWSEDRIEAAKELMKLIPPLSDMVRFADFSAFDPEVIEKWREFYEPPETIKKPLTDAFNSIGIFGDWINKYWFSHYVQPGRYELGELLKRSKGWEINPTPKNTEKLEELEVTEDDLTLAYRTMAYSEFWQKRLIELAKEIPTRVDVRRWWDMRTIDEPRLRQLYQAQGYFGDDLEDYITWTKVYTDFPDLIARFKNGWINLEEVKAQLLADGMPEARMLEMLETKFKPEAPARVAESRLLTRTLIMKGYKLGQINREKCIELLMVQQKYDRPEAEYIVAVEEAGWGSPETPLEYEQLVDAQRRAMGEEVREIPQEVIAAEKAFLSLDKQVKAAYERKAEQTEIDSLEVAKAEAGARYRELLILHGL